MAGRASVVSSDYKKMELAMSILTRLKKMLLFTSIDLGHCGNTDGGSNVDVSGSGSQPCVIPVLVVRSELFGDVGLDNVNPLGQLDLS